MPAKIFFDERDDIRPALDFVKAKAFVTVPLDIEVPIKKSKSESEIVEVRRRTRLVTITSDREVIEANEEAFAELNLRLAGSIAVPARRWSLKSIEQFIEGKEKGQSFAEVFHRIYAQYQRYIDFQDSRAYDFFSLWIIGSYFFPLFQSYPFIYIGGVKESGKTKTLLLTQKMAFNAVLSGNVSTPALFRVIEGSRATFLLDESEKLSNQERAQEFRSLLNSSYKPGNPVYRVERTVKDQFIVQSFEVYSPKIIANISGIENVLESRTVHFPMLRTLNKEIANREIENVAGFEIIRDCLYFLVMKRFREVRDAYEHTHPEEGISARSWEMWKPILALAKVVDGEQGNDLYNKIAELGRQKTKERLIEDVLESQEAILLETLIKMVKDSSYYSVREIKSQMMEKLEDSPNWLSSEWIGKAMRRLNFTNKRRLGRGIDYLLTVETVADRAKRAGISPKDYQVEF